MKTSRFLLVIAALAPMAAVEAQNPPAGPPPNPIATVFRNRTAAARRNIAQALDSIPASKFDFKPTEKQQTVGYVAQHIADDTYLFCNNFSDRKATRTEAESAPDTVKAKWPKDSLVAQYKRAIAFCDEVMANMDDAAATAIITVTNPQNNTTRQVARMNYLLGHAMDLQDHYSQLANYMRLMGMLPPTALPRPGRGGN
jgi:uncharacterized damage-inducible protein DinB